MLPIQGADNVISEKLKVSSKQLSDTMEHVTRYAEEGLRVLMVGCRDISEEEYTCWKENYLKAETSIENKECLVSQSFNDIETNLKLLGATAVEDRLQVRWITYYIFWTITIRRMSRTLSPS